VRISVSNELKFWASQKIKSILNTLKGCQFSESTPLRVVTTANVVDLPTRSMIVLQVI